MTNLDKKKKQTIVDSLAELDELMRREITIDLHSGTFYRETDDETLQECLSQMWESQEEWLMRGVQIGFA